MSHFFVSFELQVQRPARGPPNLGNRVRGTANMSPVFNLKPCVAQWVKYRRMNASNSSFVKLSMILPTYSSKSGCHICAAWRKRATELKARAVRDKTVEGRVHHRITPGSLPVSDPSSCGASPSGLCSSVRLDTCGSPSAMTFDGDGGTGGLGVCGDVDDGIGSDVSVHEPHIFYFSAKPQGSVSSRHRLYP